MQLTRVLPFLILTALLLTACASAFPDIKVATEANPKAKFDGYKTYKWAAAAAIIRDAGGSWTAPELDIGAEIVFLANRELRGKGLTEVTHSPDIAVLYAVGVDMDALDVIVDKKDGETTEKPSPKGAVMIILIEPDTRRVIWTGRATANVQANPTTELSKQRLDYAITELFKKFGR